MRPSISFPYENIHQGPRSHSRDRFPSVFSSNNPFSQYQQSQNHPSFRTSGFTSGSRNDLLGLSHHVGLGLRAPIVLPGYIPPGTHPIPPSTSHQGQGRRGHSQTNGFLSQLHQQRLGRSFHGLQSAFHGARNHQEPIFPEDEESFFPGETLPPILNSEDYLDFGGGYSLSFLETQDERTREKFGERLASFPELPLDAHKRIFQMGNDIVDCFEVRLERFYRGSLLDSVANCTAVFTKKERTGQRWLMVFKQEISRTVVKFNRLLTHSLLVSVVSETAIEIEAAKSMYGPPAEMCVINFRNTDESCRFFRTLQESQTTAWNHREVTQEQRMKNLFSQINVAMAQSDLINSPAPPARSPFTMRDRGDPLSLLSNTALRSSTPMGTPVPSPSVIHIADLDDDWRNNSNTPKDEENPFVSVAQSSAAQLRKRNKALSPTGSNGNGTGSNASASLFHSMTHKNAIKMDGSGDTADLESETFPEEEIALELHRIKLIVKKDNGFEEVGPGTLRLVDHKDYALNELKLEGENREELFHQFIYKWNNMIKICNGSLGCCWDGAATVAPITNDAVPERKNFKILFDDQGKCDSFFDTFQASVEKAKVDVIRKRHINWYLKVRGSYTGQIPTIIHPNLSRKIY